MSNMGARVVRMFRNFNLENRVHREISKEKPRTAPRHEVRLPPSVGSSEGERPKPPLTLCSLKSPPDIHRVDSHPASDITLPVRLSKEDLGKASTVDEHAVPCVSDLEKAVTQKNDPLLALLKSVYVESKDPAAAEVRPRLQPRRVCR